MNSANRIPLFGRAGAMLQLFSHYWLAIAVFVFGCCYAAVTAPFGVPDEFAHFWRACHISEGHIRAKTNQDGVRGGVLPTSEERIVEALVHYHSIPLPPARI